MLERASIISLPLVNAPALEFVFIPPSTFVMGSADDDIHAEDTEKPAHSILLNNGFWIMTAPVTRIQLNAVLDHRQGRYEASPESPASQHSWLECVHFCQKFTTLTREYLPDIVVNSRDATNNFALRLPTETEWEYACRGVSRSRWFFGNNPEDIIQFAWCGLKPGSKLPAVRQKKPNPQGLYDVYGSVYEWCDNDFYSYNIEPVKAYHYVQHKSSYSNFNRKVARGGCIYDSPLMCRSASRRLLLAANSENDLTGFRMVINV